MRMSTRPTSFIERKAPYIFIVALIATLMLSFWTPPTTVILLTSAAAGGIMFLVRWFFPRMDGVDANILFCLIGLMPGLWAARDKSTGLVLYLFLFFLTVSSLHCLTVRLRHDDA
jgi:hypothetical protein